MSKSANRIALQCTFLVLSYLALGISTANAQSASLDQGANGRRTAPTTPIDWVNGNLNTNQAHFLEGHSVPIRATLKSLIVNKSYTIAIGYDNRANGKNAMDYLTQHDRLDPHFLFGHTTETIDPVANISGFPASYFTSTDTYPIPPPSSLNADVAGMPTTSFNAIPASKRVFTGYNADITNITYASEGALNASASETVILVTFTALKATAVLAWGGHLSNVADWGRDASGQTRSASGINGSPYHTRLKYWVIDGVTTNIGNQDKSLKTDAVYVPPVASATGPLNACTTASSLTYTSTVDDAVGLTYLWSIVGSNTAGAKIVSNTLANIQVVPIGAQFTAGTFNLQLIVTRNGFNDTCFINGDVTPGASVTIEKVTANAGADQSISDLETAQLQASASGSPGTYTYAWSPSTGLSNPNIANPVFTPPAIGTYQFIVTATSQYGCTGKDTVVVTVTQHVKPPCSINGPSPFCPGSTNTYTGPATNVSGYLWSVSGGATIVGANNGQSVSIKAGNTCGNYILQLITTASNGVAKDTCTIPLQAKDVIAPVLSGSAANATVSCSKDIPAVAQITATDNCSSNLIVGYAQIVSDSICVNKYTINRKWWATDACGNTSDTLRQTIIVNDNVKPVITSGFTAAVNVQCAKDIPATPTPTATDNCDGNLQAVYTEQGSGSACDSTITRKWTFTDACGNSDFVTQVIHIKDNTAPVLAGTAANANVSCSKDIPAVANITATDNCNQNISVQYSQITSDSTCVNKYTLTRKWWAIDACGNKSDTLTQVIVVNDNVKPVISADFTKDISVQCLKDVPVAPVPTVTDNCNGTLQAVYSEQGSGSACDSAITRKWIFTDACGNSDEVIQTIHIKDNTAPVLAGTAANANVSCSRDIPAVASITATDNCDQNVVVQYSQVTSDSTCVNKFTLTRKWWAVDACGNTSTTLTQIIVVNDDVKPVITANFTKDINVQCLKDVPAAPVPTATDNCDDNVQPVYSEEGTGSACDSTIIRKWIFTDACGNSDFVMQTIHIKDNTAPVLAGTAANANVSCSKDIPAVATITATDNCDQNVAVQFSQVISDSTCVNKFTITRKWWAVDACGNTSETLTQIIVVNDDVKPVITADFTKDVNVQCLKDVPAAPAPTATDNCDDNVQPVYSEEGAGSACDSTIIRKWIFTDACGNSDFVIQTIHIKDNTAPILAGTAANANVSCSKDIPAIAAITATDNCDQNVAVQFSQVTSDSTCVNKFTITRKWWAVDACGNTSETLTQIIVVNDDVKPVITADFIKDVNVQCLKDVPAAPTPTATDNCDENVQPVYSEEGAGSACDSTIIRKWVFADACGNSDQVTQTIHIKDNIVPVLVGSVSNANISCAKDIPAIAIITATDNCDQNVAVQYSQVTSDSTCVNKFTITRKWWAVDACGNTSETLTQVIVVNDDVKPVITADFTKEINVQCLKDVPAAPAPTATDNCDENVQPVYSEEGSGSACDSTIIRKWVFTDACGNSDFVIQTIHIKDNTAPVLAGTAANANVSCSKDIPAVASITATDNCDENIAVQFSQVTSDSTCVNKFTITRKWWAVDACGNTSETMTQVIVVNDDVKPVITADFTKEINVQCMKDVPAAPAPTATDNCDENVQPVYSEEGSGSACDSTIIRKWVFTDACGNSDQVIQTIHIKDNTIPVLVGSVSNANISCAKDIPAVAEITATDNCDQNVAVQYSQVTSDSTCVNKFTLTRKWWAVDACGNTSTTLTQIIVVNDDVKPVITADFTKEINVQCMKDVPAAPAPTATDNCDETVQPVYSEEGSGSACDSTIIRKWIFTDACGNSDFVIQTIHIKDNTAPVLAGTAANVNVSCSRDIPAVATITATDNCDENVAVQYSQVTSDSTCVNKFTLTRKWWAVDACGNTSETMTQVIVVNDDVKPVITADFTKEINVQCLKDVPAAPVPTATDNCDDNVQPVYSEEGSGSACDSTIIRKWIFTDACGNSDFVIQTIHIKDNIIPVLVGSVSNTNISCAKDIPAVAEITATDNCDQNVAVQFSQVTSDSTCVNKFTITRKWWAVDACGNTSETLTQVIVVNDDVKPTITADFAKEINVQCLKDVPAAPVPTATDNCDDNVQPVYSEEGSGSACDSTIIRKWIFTDACGNSDEVIQTIHIKDNIIPVLVGSVSNANISCAKDIPAVATITATDNCDENVAVQFSQVTSDSTCVNKFTITRKWWAVDACGNTSETMTQVIVVNDDVKPVITADFTKEINVQCLKDVPAAPTPTATDNCDENVQPVYSEEGSGSACDSTIIRKWIFTDACGNSDQVIQTIHIKDNTIPALVGSVSNTNISCAKDIPAVAEITATDNCDQNVTVQFSQVTSDSTCVNKFTLTRKWWAVDACGNTSDTMTQVIVVNDDVKPVITADFTKEINVQCLKDVPAAPTPTATDNCDETVQPVYSEEGSGSACDSTIIRKWVFTDACGNSDEVAQTIHIKDNTIPVLVGSVSNTNISCAKEIPAVATITATDNCDENIAVQYSQVTSDSTCVNKFTLTRKWWAVDACGNTSDTMTQVIVVNDDIKPVISADFTKEINVQCLKDVPAAPAPTATDNCDENIQPVYSEEGSGSACDSTIIRKWIFTDACGNSDEVTQTIHIKDNTIPVLVGSVSNANISCAKDIPAVAEITATDNCDQNVAVQFSQVTSDSTCVNKFTLTRKWWAVDACGNTSETMTQVIVVNDDVKPVITADFNKEINVQCLKDVPAAPTPTATDNCDETVQPVYSEEGSGSACDSTIIRKWIFTDACGNSDEVTQTIHIKDNTIPVLVGSVSNTNISCAKDIPAVAEITATDNCDQNVAVQYSQVTSDSTCVNKFILTRKWWAVDACGNTSDTMTQVIVVNDDVKPVIAADFTKEINVQCLKDVPAAPAPTATDNCDENVQPVYSEEGSGSACDSTIIRKWVFTDACGNSDEVTQTIHIKDNTIPVLVGNVSNTNISCAKDIPAVTEITATDNCDQNVAVQYSQVTSDSTCVNKFTITRKWWAVDACGNTSDTMTQIIVVNDDVKPVITADFTKEINVQCLKDVPAAPVPTATDNCDETVQPVYSEEGSGSACDSTIIRKWIFTDACGNSEQVTQTIHIKDNTIPVLVGNVSNANISCAKDIPAVAEITATDNCDQNVAVQFSQVTSDSTCVNKFTISRKWWAVDACGNTSDTMTQVIVVNDDIKPVVTADFTKEINVQCLKDVPAAPTPTATDNCDQNIQPVYSEEGSGSACDSTITRKWIFTDACGNSDATTQVIHIKDNTAPILAGSVSNINISCAQDIPAVAQITATDNCDQHVAVQYSQVTSDSTCVNKFTLTRKWWAVDACGNTSDIMTQIITVNDDQKPAITANFTKEINVQCVKDIPAVPVPTATDNCNANIQPVYSEQGTGTACDSTIIRKWIFTDACGNSDEVTQTIHIKDTTRPILTGTASNAPTNTINTIYVNAANQVPAPATFSGIDNCSGKLSAQFDEAVTNRTCESKYTLTRKWWVVDACGNVSDTFTQVIIVNDDLKPVITAGFDKEIKVQCIQQIPAVPTPTATDNSSGNIAPVYSEAGSGSACDSTITRRWTFTDDCGNSDFVTQVIHIKDTIAPVLSGSVNNLSLSCAKAIPAAANISATDNCNQKVAVQYRQLTTDSTCVNKFTITRKWWAVDACGNTSDTIKQVITVNDNVKPVITANFSKTISVQCLKDVPAAPVPTATDNCDDNVQPVYSVQGAGSACDSTITRKWIFTDACGNSDEVTQIIRIKDDTKPVISSSFPAEVNVQCIADVPPVPVPTATDNCNGNVQPVYTVQGAGSACDSTITRKWTFTDACGNSAFITQTIHIKASGILNMVGSVKDMTVATIADVPAPQTMQATGSCTAPIMHFTQTVTDSACVNKFTITRKWWATDACGYKSNTMVQTITVNDNIAPVATNIAQDKTQACKTTPVFTQPTFTDNSNLPVAVTYSDNYSNTGCPQVVTRTWQATDVCGNVTIVKQAVTIPCCNESICTYAAGFYGTPKASVCVNGGGTTTSNQIMISAVDKQPGDSAIFGLKSTGKFFTLSLADVSGGAIFEMLPAGGKPASLKGYATYTKPQTWSNVPLSEKNNSYGSIQNSLLAQAMTLFFNISNSTNVGGLKIEGDSLFTAKETTCGSGVAVNKVDVYVLPKNVVDYLRSNGQNTAQGLLDLANRYLGGQLPTGIDAGEITSTIQILNSAFEGCRLLKRWGNTTLPSIHGMAAPVDPCASAGSLQVVGVFPNPYTDKVYFRFIAPETGTALLEVWNLLGQELQQIRKSVTKCNNEEILYNVPMPNRVSFGYRLSVGNTVIKTGIVICTE